MYERFTPTKDGDEFYIQDNEGIIDLRSTVNVCSMLNVLNENCSKFKAENKQLKELLKNGKSYSLPGKMD